jgi:hypothetical protein
MTDNAVPAMAEGSADPGTAGPLKMARFPDPSVQAALSASVASALIMSLGIPKVGPNASAAGSAGSPPVGGSSFSDVLAQGKPGANEDVDMAKAVAAAIEGAKTSGLGQTNPTAADAQKTGSATAEAVNGDAFALAKPLVDAAADSTATAQVAQLASMAAALMAANAAAGTLQGVGEDGGERAGLIKGGFVKGQWTKEEDELVCKYVELYGTKQWARIALVLPGEGMRC